MVRLYAAAATAAILAVLGGTYGYVRLAMEADPFAQCRETAIAGGAQIGGPFTLLDEFGASVTDETVITQPSLLYFGYTYCPDVCPFDVARNAIAIDILAERGVEVTPIFISVDPDRDTPEQVGAFAYNMHPRMIGLTGTPEQVAAVSRAYKTYYRKHDGDGDDYLVDHSTFSYLVAPEIGFMEFYRRDEDPDDMADSIACFVDAI